MEYFLLSLSLKYPEITLDTFSFLVGCCLAAQQAIFCTHGWIFAIFGNSFFAGITTPNFGLRPTKIGLFGLTNIFFFFSLVKKEPFLCRSSGRLSGSERASYDALVSW